jgi:3-phenylpropionate/trans-cinnamate dioxygenase ferredoxin subunit
MSVDPSNDRGQEMTEHSLFALSDLADQSARKVEVDGHEIAIVRIGDDVYAIGDVCSHAEVSLSEGFVDPDDCAIECVKHGAMFDLETGEPITLPATRPVPVYAVAVIDDEVVLTISGSEDPT